MKMFVRVLLLPVVFAAGLPFAQADQPTKSGKLTQSSESETKKERRIFHHLSETQERETVTFLGVETVPVSPALTAQLGLPKDAGLVIRNVVPDSPAAAVLQVHDILLKLDDQLLIDSRQFSVLVRNRQAGEEITLSYVRGGKPATVKIKLTTHEVPKQAFFGLSGPEDENFEFPAGGRQAFGLAQDGKMRHVLSLLDQGRAERMRALPSPTHGNVGYRALSVNVPNSSMLFNDDQGSLELTIKEGKKTLLAKNPKGEQLFSGPIDTPEQRKALPEDVHARLDKLEGMQEFSFEPDAHFRTDVKVFRPAPSEIDLPLPAPADVPDTRPADAF